MDGIKNAAFTGNTKEGNPYSGDLEKGIHYDVYEANFNLIEQKGDKPEILTPYRSAARKLIRYFFADKERHKLEYILDIGSGTGISTLELLSQNPKIFVLGVEISEGMLHICNYKFHKIDGGELKDTNDNNLIKYWEEFKSESKRYKDNVSFLLGDIQKTEEIEPESIDGAIGNQVMHWTDLSKSFAQLNKFLKDGSSVVWNTSSHFYNDLEFPSAEFGFRYNDFLGLVLEEIRKKVDVNDYRTLSVPQHNIDTIKDVTLEQRFRTEQIATFLVPVDFQVFIKHIPPCVKSLITSETNDDEIQHIIKDAIAKTINNPAAFGDVKHKFDVNPIFRSTKY